MPAGRCGASGCGRFAPKGVARCRLHTKNEMSGEELQAGETHDEVPDFDRWIGLGEFDGLLSPELMHVIEQAGGMPDLGFEIGALRVVLARILSEERDPNRLASGVARVAEVAVRAVRAQHSMRLGSHQTLQEELERVLRELDAETVIDLNRGEGGTWEPTPPEPKDFDAR